MTHNHDNDRHEDLWIAHFASKSLGAPAIISFAPLRFISSAMRFRIVVRIQADFQIRGLNGPRPGTTRVSASVNPTRVFVAFAKPPSHRSSSESDTLQRKTSPVIRMLGREKT
jgi:hypothetical protein